MSIFTLFNIIPMGIGSWNSVVRHLPGAQSSPRRRARRRSASSSTTENRAYGGSNTRTSTKPNPPQEPEDEDQRAAYLKARSGLIEQLERNLNMREELVAAPVPALKQQPAQGGIKRWLHSIDFSIADPWIIGGAVLTGLFVLICFAILEAVGQ